MRIIFKDDINITNKKIKFIIKDSLYSYNIYINQSIIFTLKD